MANKGVTVTWPPLIALAIAIWVLATFFRDFVAIPASALLIIVLVGWIQALLRSRDEDQPTA